MALFSTSGMYGTDPYESVALVRQSLDCLLGIAPRDAGLGVLSGRLGGREGSSGLKPWLKPRAESRCPFGTRAAGKSAWCGQLGDLPRDLSLPWQGCFR